MIFLGYALIIGIPALAFILWFWCPKPGHQIPSLKKQLNESKQVFSFRIYWALVFNICVFTVNAAFFFPLVTNQMKWHGATDKETEQYLLIWSIILPGTGFITCIIVGLVMNYKNKWALFGSCVLNVIVMAMTMACATIQGSPLWVQIFTFLGIIFFRMNTAALFNSVMPSLFENMLIGKAIGLSWTLAGCVSAGVVSFIVEAITKDPDNFLIAYLVVGGLGCLGAGVLGILFLTDVDPQGRALGLQPVEE